ncbi:MAG: InlB B-repeat-containing protein, partial [Duncaniella sp.]|nr:InlB B-repeat-containing protein [Duncaniella sp.]
MTPPPEWTVNPADYRYDMSLYFNVAFASSKQTVDLSQYEIASFVGDECRGVAEAISGVENCLYMRIRSNSENGETISFKIRNRQTGDVTEIENETIPFEADKAVGLPSAPLNIAIVTYYDVNITATTGGSVNFKNGRYAEGTTLEVTAIPDPNYSFVSWSDGVTEPTRAITVDNDITLEASFEAEKYTLTYIIDGVTIESVKLEFGAKITPVQAPEKPGYTFAGWEGLPETMPANDVTVTGNYTLNKYKLAYVIDGINVETVELEFGAKINPIEAPAKEGHTFAGWTGFPEDMVMPANDVTVTGSYTINKYKLAYVIDGKNVETVELEFGAKINPIEAPAKEGHTFAGWTGFPEDMVMPANDVTVTGSYTINKYKLAYVIDGKNVETVELEFGAKINPIEAPVKEGHTFARWEGLPETMPANDVTVNAVYTVNSYKLTYI